MSLRDLLVEKGVAIADSTHRHARSGWINIDCPDCGPRSGKFHLGISDAGAAHCWRCGRKKLSEVLDALGIPKNLRRPGSRRQFGIKNDDRTGVYDPPKDKGPLGKAHRRYLSQRGFDPDELVEIWGIEGIGLSAEYPWRIFAPITDEGRSVSWTTRTIGADNEQRYLTAPPERESFPAKSLLYGEDQAGHVVCVVEGVTDAWAIGPGAVATMGTSYTRDQVSRIASHPVRLICFDREETAQKRARELGSELASFKGDTMVVQLETGKDAGDAEEWELQELRSLLT